MKTCLTWCIIMKFKLTNTFEFKDKYKKTYISIKNTIIPGTTFTKHVASGIA